MTNVSSIPVPENPARAGGRLGDLQQAPSAESRRSHLRIGRTLVLLVSLLASSPATAFAQTYQWSASSTGSFARKGIAVAPVTPATVLVSDGFYIDRSANAGASWSRASMPFGSFPGGAIAFDPNDPSIVYSARGHGMMKSIDGGANWFLLPDLNAGPGANAIVVDPRNSNVLYVGVGAGWGIYKSVNGGTSWTNLITSRDVQALALDPSNSQVLLASTKDYYSTPGVVLRSVDGGQSWTTAWANSKITALAFDPVNPQVVYAGAESGGVFKSPNGGLGWALSGTAPTPSPVATVIVNPTAANRLLVATKGGGVYVSNDSGSQWALQNTGLADLNCTGMALHTPSGVLFAATYSGAVYVGAPLTFASSATPFGSGCGTPALSLAGAARPILATTARATLTNVPSASAFLAIGASKTAIGPFALPMSLAPYGMPGCSLLQSTEVAGIQLTMGSGSTANYALAVPNWASLLGIHLYLQGYAYAPGANPTQVIVSNGLDWLLGNT